MFLPFPIYVVFFVSLFSKKRGKKKKREEKKIDVLCLMVQVLISGKEEPEAPFSPAMDAVIRIFKRISGLQENEGGGMTAAAAVGFSSMRLLVASTQAINLIGKQGSLIKSIQESTSASVRVLSSGTI